MSSKPPSPTRRALRLPGRIARRWYDRGLTHTARWFTYQLSWRYREWKLGIRTGEFDHGFVVPGEGDYLGYEPIDVRCFEIILDYLDVQPGRDVFLDIGCGKGRAIILASMRPFKAVIGVERSRSLCAVADANVRAVEAQLQCSDVRIVNEDAQSYEIPASVNTIYMFRPFTGEVLHAVLEQIRASLLRAVRPLRVIYVLPARERDALASCPWLRREGLLPAGFWTHVKCSVYAADPVAAEAFDVHAWRSGAAEDHLL